MSEIKVDVEDIEALVPDGWVVVRIGLARVDEHFLVSGRVDQAAVDQTINARVILSKKRWRATRGGTYWTLGATTHGAYSDLESFTDGDNNRYRCGNYFMTEKQADAAAEKVKSLMLSLYEEG